jgi:pimeloyl-ACP methyl ester carboxylesterase
VVGVRPILLPLLEHGARRAIQRRGGTTARHASVAGRIHVYDTPGTGAAPPIVLLHGISATGASFAPLIEQLRPHARRVIALDFPGHGYSDPPRATLTPELLVEATGEVLGRLVREPYVVAGNSLGGAVAVHHAIAHPDRVRALVLLSPGGAASSDAEWDALRATFDIRSRRDALAFVARVQDHPPWLVRLVAHELVARTQRPAVRDLLATTTPAHAIDPVALRALAQPILLWWGRSERLLPASHLAWWQAHLPRHAIVEQPDGIGHCPHLDAPGRVAARIAQFAQLSN